MTSQEFEEPKFGYTTRNSEKSKKVIAFHFFIICIQRID